MAATLSSGAAGASFVLDPRTMDAARSIVKRTRQMFLAEADVAVGDGAAPGSLPAPLRTRLTAKIVAEYGPEALVEDPTATGGVGGYDEEAGAGTAGGDDGVAGATAEDGGSKGSSVVASLLSGILAEKKAEITGTSIVPYAKAAAAAADAANSSRHALARREPTAVPVPKWHAPWKLKRVISGHGGWVRCVAVDPSNQWFVTGSADRTIKVWDLAAGTLRLTLTGHINAVRGLAVSDRNPYMYSVSEDKRVLCWDLEVNKVIRHYHGHLSGVYSVALHPTLDVLITGGRDSVARVWDIRTKSEIHVLSGHHNTVSTIITNPTDPQVITGSMDSTIRLWDLAAGKTMVTLTNHKKSVRHLVGHPKQFTFCSGAADNIKKWQCADGKFLHNMSGHNSIINCLAVNSDDVFVSGGDDGSLRFWDYQTGYQFCSEQSKVQPGSLDSEAGILAMSFDRTGSRLITCESDKTIKIWAEDTSATPETHPIDMEAWTSEVRRYKRY